MTMQQRKPLQLRIDANGTDRDAFITLKSIEKNIVSFVSQGQNLYIHSTRCGNGKTAWALRLMQAYFNSIWHKTDFRCRGLFVNVPRYLIALKESITKPSAYVDAIKDNILDADIVIFDELGTKVVTTYEHEYLLSSINARLDASKTCIYTSNLSPTELRGSLGDRLYSRVVHCSTEIELFGRDKRGITS